MRIRDFLPMVGQSGTVQRYKDLEKKAATLPVFFALFFSESVKIAALAFPQYTPSTKMDIAKMFIAAVIVAIIYIYELDEAVADEIEDVELD